MEKDYIAIGSIALLVIKTIVDLKIFARSSEVPNLEARLMKYAMEHFVTNDTYSDNHKALQNQMLQIHNDISEVKTLLIKMSSGNKN